MEAEKHEGWDRVGQGLSLLCLVHCLATPVVLGLLPSLGFLLHNALVHLVLAVVVVGVSLVAFGTGFRRHRRPVVPLLGAVGVMGLLIATLVLEPRSELMGTLGTIVASIVLVVAHTMNRGGLRVSPHAA